MMSRKRIPYSRCTNLAFLKNKIARACRTMRKLSACVSYSRSRNFLGLSDATISCVQRLRDIIKKLQSCTTRSCSFT